MRSGLRGEEADACGPDTFLEFEQSARVILGHASTKSRPGKRIAVISKATGRENKV